MVFTGGMPLGSSAASAPTRLTPAATAGPPFSHARGVHRSAARHDLAVDAGPAALLRPVRRGAQAACRGRCLTRQPRGTRSRPSATRNRRAILRLLGDGGAIGARDRGRAADQPAGRLPAPAGAEGGGLRRRGAGGHPPDLPAAGRGARPPSGATWSGCGARPPPGSASWPRTRRRTPSEVDRERAAAPRAVDVACPAEHAFTVWTAGIGTWWPADHTVTGERGLRVVLEPRVGGRIYERTPVGAEHEWGEVTAWEPPSRLAYLWFLRADRADATDVEIRFIATGAGTRVEIEHRGWERLGARATAGATATSRAGRRCCRTSRGGRRLSRRHPAVRTCAVTSSATRSAASSGIQWRDAVQHLEPVGGGEKAGRLGRGAAEEGVPVPHTCSVGTRTVPTGSRRSAAAPGTSRARGERARLAACASTYRSTSVVGQPAAPEHPPQRRPVPGQQQPLGQDGQLEQRPCSTSAAPGRCAPSPCAIAAGCGTDTAVSVRTRSGCQAASAHATMPPQSCPTTCALSSPAASSRARTSSTRLAHPVAGPARAAGPGE